MKKRDLRSGRGVWQSPGRKSLELHNGGGYVIRFKQRDGDIVEIGPWKTERGVGRVLNQLLSEGQLREINDSVTDYRCNIDWWSSEGHSFDYNFVRIPHPMDAGELVKYLDENVYWGNEVGPRFPKVEFYPRIERCAA